MSLKPALLKLCIAASALMSGAPDSPVRNYALVPNEELVVNTDTARSYVSTKSRKDGEKDLLALTESSKLEEFWIFAEGDGKSMWIEAGCLETSGSINMQWDRANELKYLSADSVSFYHIHPYEKPELIDYVQLPSHFDFSFCKRATVFVRDNVPYLKDNADCMVVVPTGVYTIKIEKGVIDDSELLEEYEEKVKAIESDIGSILTSGMTAFDYTVKNEKNFPELNKKLAERLTDKLVKVTFEKK